VLTLDENLQRRRQRAKYDSSRAGITLAIALGRPLRKTKTSFADMSLSRPAETKPLTRVIKKGMER